MEGQKVRVSSNGEFVIPKEIRKRYKITAGTELILKPLDDYRLIVERVPKLSELFGFLGDAKTSSLLQEEREKEIQTEREASVEKL